MVSTAGSPVNRGVKTVLAHHIQSISALQVLQVQQLVRTEESYISCDLVMQCSHPQPRDVSAL